MLIFGPHFKMKYLEQLGEGKLLNIKQKVVYECMSVCYDKSQEQEDNTTLCTSEPPDAILLHCLRTMKLKPERSKRKHQMTVHVQ